MSRTLMNMVSFFNIQNNPKKKLTSGFERYIFDKETSHSKVKSTPLDNIWTVYEHKETKERIVASGYNSEREQYIRLGFMMGSKPYGNQKPIEIRI